jgi:hypothetical protein
VTSGCLGEGIWANALFGGLLGEPLGGVLRIPCCKGPGIRIAHLTYRSLVRQIRRVLPAAVPVTPSASGKCLFAQTPSRYRYSVKKPNHVFLEEFEIRLPLMRGVTLKVSA